MDFLKLLLDNAYSKRQLFKYLKDSRNELMNNGSVYKNGHLFNIAYGLDLSLNNVYDLGLYIKSGEFLAAREKFRD